EELQIGPENVPHADRMLDLLDRDEAVLYYLGHVEWRFDYRGQPVYLQADRLTIHARKSETAPSSSAPQATEAKGGLLGNWRDLSFFADGNVRVEIPSRKTYFEADSFYYEHSTSRGIARGVRLKTTFQNARGLYSRFTVENFRPGPEIPVHAHPGRETFLI